MKKIKLLPIAIASLLALTACGGDEESSQQKADEVINIYEHATEVDVINNPDAQLLQTVSSGVRTVLENYSSSESVLLDATLSGSIEADADLVHNNDGNRQEVKVAASIKNLDAQIGAGVTGYRSGNTEDLKGFVQLYPLNGNLSVNYQLPVFDEQAEYSSWLSLLKPSANFQTSFGGAEASVYLTNNSIYADATNPQLLSFANTVKDNVLSLPEAIGTMSVQEIFANALGISALKLGFENVIPFSEFSLPSIPVAIANYIPALPEVLKDPQTKTMVSSIVSMLNAKAYTFDADSEYSFAVSVGVKSFAELTNIVKTIAKVDLNQAIPAGALSFNTFKLSAGVAVMKNGTVELTVKEDIDGKFNGKDVIFSSKEHPNDKCEISLKSTATAVVRASFDTRSEIVTSKLPADLDNYTVLISREVPVKEEPIGIDIYEG